MRLFEDIKFTDEQLQPASPDSLALNDKTYGNIVNGWNEKISANNVKISSLIENTPFLSVVIATADAFTPAADLEVEMNTVGVDV